MVLTDVDQDGYVDGQGLDADQNGGFEQLLADRNQDGVVDATALDANSDGIYESAAYDSNQDGVADAPAPSGGGTSLVIEHSTPFNSSATGTPGGTSITITPDPIGSGAGADDAILAAIEKAQADGNYALAEQLNQMLANKIEAERRMAQVWLEPTHDHHH